MTLNGVMAVILRYFTKFGSFQGALHKTVKVTLAEKTLAKPTG